MLHPEPRLDSVLLEGVKILITMGLLCQQEAWAGRGIVSFSAKGLTL